MHEAAPGQVQGTRGKVQATSGQVQAMSGQVKAILGQVHLFWAGQGHMWTVPAISGQVWATTRQIQATTCLQFGEAGELLVCTCLQHGVIVHVFSFSSSGCLALGLVLFGCAVPHVCLRC